MIHSWCKLVVMMMMMTKVTQEALLGRTVVWVRTERGREGISDCKCLNVILELGVKVVT